MSLLFIIVLAPAIPNTHPRKVLEPPARIKRERRRGIDSAVRLMTAVSREKGSHKGLLDA